MSVCVRARGVQVLKDKETVDGTDDVIEVFGEPNSGVICYDDSWCKCCVM